MNNQPNTVTCLDFSKNVDFKGNLFQEGTIFPGTKIEIRFRKRDPFSKLKEKGLLVVSLYAWDGNSFPGKDDI